MPRTYVAVLELKTNTWEEWDSTDLQGEMREPKICVRGPAVWFHAQSQETANALAEAKRQRLENLRTVSLAPRSLNTPGKRLVYTCDEAGSVWAVFATKKGRDLTTIVVALPCADGCDAEVRDLLTGRLYLGQREEPEDPWEWPENENCPDWLNAVADAGWALYQEERSESVAGEASKE